MITLEVHNNSIAGSMLNRKSQMLQKGYQSPEKDLYDDCKF